MSVLNRIACLQGRRDEVPNQELARELVEHKDREGIEEIARNLWNKDVDIQNDCIKVLYEIGYLAPELVSMYTPDFLELLKSPNNRIVWGSMLGLSTVAALQADEIFPHVKDVMHAMEQGSVITRDNGVKVLAAVASINDEYRRTIFPFLLKHLDSCRPKDVPQHAENMAGAVDASVMADFIRVLESRLEEISPAQAVRVRKVIRSVESKCLEHESRPSTGCYLCAILKYAGPPKQ